jgi:hypothetical protein
METGLSLRDMVANPRIVSAAVIACGVVLGSLAYTGTFSSITFSPTTTPTPTTEKTPAQRLAEKDDNSNGIPDWQELNTTTTSTPPTTETTPPTREELQKKYTKTELLAGDLFGVYFERKEGDVYTPADNEAIIANALAGLDITNIPRFTEGDISIRTYTTTTDADTAARVYRDAVTDVVRSLDAIGEYELQTYARATEKNDPTEFKKVLDAADVYATAVESLKKISVPDTAVGAHLALMNGFTKLSLALLEMSKGYDDIAASYAALKTFGEAEKDIELAYTLHRTYLAIHNAINL